MKIITNENTNSKGEMNMITLRINVYNNDVYGIDQDILDIKNFAIDVKAINMIERYFNGIEFITTYLIIFDDKYQQFNEQMLIPNLCHIKYEILM